MVARPERVRFVTRDNAGIKACYSVHRVGYPWGRVLASVTRVVGTRYKRGDLVPLVVTTRRVPHTRRGGICSAAHYNGVIPVKKDGSPVGTRVYGAVYLEVRAQHSRLAVVAAGLL